MFKVHGFGEMEKRTKEYRLQQELAKADFRCDSCGAPVYINYRLYTNMFGNVMDTEAKASCQYCGAEYKVNAYEFDLYRNRRKLNEHSCSDRVVIKYDKGARIIR